MKEKTMIVLMVCLLAGMVLTQSGYLSAQVQQARTCQETQTVFQDVSKFGRKDRAASNMTRKHAELAKEDWTFRDMETYIENSDLEGFYLTYTRETACNQAGVS